MSAARLQQNWFAVLCCSSLSVGCTALALLSRWERTNVDVLCFVVALLTYLAFNNDRLPVGNERTGVFFMPHRRLHVHQCHVAALLTLLVAFLLRHSYLLCQYHFF